MILLMAIFSIYAGVLYNDIFSKPFNIFGCKYRIVYEWVNSLIQCYPLLVCLWKLLFLGALSLAVVFDESCWKSIEYAKINS